MRELAKRSSFVRSRIQTPSFKSKSASTPFLIRSQTHCSCGVQSFSSSIRVLLLVEGKRYGWDYKNCCAVSQTVSRQGGFTCNTCLLSQRRKTFGAAGRSGNATAAVGPPRRRLRRLIIHHGRPERRGPCIDRVLRSVCGTPPVKPFHTRNRLLARPPRRTVSLSYNVERNDALCTRTPVDYGGPGGSLLIEMAISCVDAWAGGVRGPGATVGRRLIE